MAESGLEGRGSPVTRETTLHPPISRTLARPLCLLPSALASLPCLPRLPQVPTAIPPPDLAGPQSSDAPADWLGLAQPPLDVLFMLLTSTQAPDLLSSIHLALFSILPTLAIYRNAVAFSVRPHPLSLDVFATRVVQVAYQTTRIASSLQPCPSNFASARPPRLPRSLRPRRSSPRSPRWPKRSRRPSSPAVDLPRPRPRPLKRLPPPPPPPTACPSPASRRWATSSRSTASAARSRLMTASRPL